MRYNVTGNSEDGGARAMRRSGRIAAFRRDMLDRVKLALFALAAAAVLGVPAALAARADQPVRANLDEDPEEELAIPQPLGADGGARRRIVVVDVCNYRNTVYHVSPVYDKVDFLKALDVDGRRPAKEILFSMSNGTSAQVGYFKLLRMATPVRPANACARPKTLFTWSSGKPTFRPRGLVFVTAGLDVKDLSRKYRGKELRLMEAWGRSRTNPSHWRYTFYRLLPDRSAYVSYGTSDIKS